MRILFACLLVSALLAGCANRQPSAVEARVQSRPTAAATTALAPAPFCLHIRYANEVQFVMSQNDAQAWVTDGPCDTDGPRRAVAELVLRWRYEHDAPGSKACTGADSCVVADRNAGTERRLACVSAVARDPGLEAGTSTDWYACAR